MNPSFLALDSTRRGLPAALFLAGLVLLPLGAAAQAAPPPAPASPSTPATDTTVQLNPFEVRTDKDTSYGALNSNSITRFNTELDKTPISADIFTETFMRDVDATSVNDMLATYGAGIGMIYATPSSDSALNQPGDRPLFGDRFTPPQIGIRGLSGGGIRRDGFTTDPTNTNKSDTWDIERVEVLRGPQGLLYGAGGAGGTIVSTSKEAHFNQRNYTVSERIDQYGSKRSLFDINAGADKIAARFVLLRDDVQQRRLFIGDLTEGAYGQFAFKLPFHSILRIEGEYTLNKRTDPSGIAVNFGSVANDPRSGYNLGLLLAMNAAGANNPATGQPYSKYGAIDNGHLDWHDYASYGGNANIDNFSNALGQATLDTVWSSWLSTSVGTNFDRTFDRNRTSVSALSAPLLNGNPYNVWAVNSNYQDTVYIRLHETFRASALVTHDFFHGIAKTQTAFGWNYEWLGGGPDDYAYYLADASGNVATTPGGTNLGRSAMGVQWWGVDGGPQLHPLQPIESPAIIGTDGKTYVRAEQNPKGYPVTATNPYGTAALQPTPANAGVVGIDASDYQFIRTGVSGLWLANYTSWWDDRFDTLGGFRRTITSVPITSGGTPNGPALHNSSFNVGFDARITPWLRGYYSFSSTYDNGIGFNDPVGIAPPTSNAHGQEVGLKFTPLDSKISGSLAYYTTHASNENTNLGAAIVNSINATGISNTPYRGPGGRNNWIPLDQKSSGVELILSAAPTKNWAVRLVATQSDGRILDNKTYDILYNDQFYTDGKGGVTYKDGSPVLVPTDATLVSKITASTNPATVLAAGVPSMPLTTAMMGDPTSDYYAWGKGNPATANGQINSGVSGTPTSDVGNVLRFFNKPGVGNIYTGAVGLPISQIQYAWPDPNHTGGKFIAAKAGDLTTGYPVYHVSLTNRYQFSEGMLRGVGVIGSVNLSWKYRTYYYNQPDGSRPLYGQPSLWQVNLSPVYEHRFRRFTWRSQVNVNNIFNHYIVSLTPNNGSGFTNPANLGFRWDGQPRSYSWSNSFDF